MILVDSSVVIDYIRTRDAKMLVLFQTRNAAICGITRAEVLHGARNPADRSRLLALLGTFGQLAVADVLWDKVGDHLAELRAHGITVPFQDVVIATVAIENDIELWTHDAQFQMIQNVLPALKLFVEPP
ncbi:MAG TPA: PIN domain-containing protein [Pirellulales bacterium]|nr:PIN domain-containing protein [Pirellulales bacterium]